MHFRTKSTYISSDSKYQTVDIFGKYNTMSGRGRRGRPRRVTPVVFERPAVPERDEQVVGSTTASMNQPPAAGQAGPSGPPEGAQVLGLFTAE